MRFSVIFPIMNELQRAVCKQCGAPLPVTADAVTCSCNHCSAVTDVYDLATIVRDGIEIWHIPDQVTPEDITDVRTKAVIPEDVEERFSWCPHWFFQGKVEGFVSGKRFTVGISGDRIQRITHQAVKTIPGRILPATLVYPRQRYVLDEIKPDELGTKGSPPEDQASFALTLDQDGALDQFEKLLKEEFLKDRKFQTNHCDRFEVICRDFQQKLVYLPLRLWRRPGKSVVLYGHNKKVVENIVPPGEMVYGMGRDRV